MKFWWNQFFSDWQAHKDAAEEIFFVCALSLIPLFALAVIDLLRSPAPQISQLFWNAIANGQLYLYSFSLLGTLYWLCQKEHENFGRFQPRRYLMFLILVPAIVIVVVYAYDPTMSKPLDPGLVKTSFFIYALYVLLYYILLVFDHLEPPDVEDQLKKETKTLISQFKEAGETNG
jgi:hypothetical protein